MSFFAGSWYLQKNKILGRWILLFACLLTCPVSGAPVDKSVEVEIILNASASMWSRLDDGTYRLDAAKNAILQWIATTSPSPDLHVGLRIHGGQRHFYEPNTCDDSELVIPVANFNPSIFEETLLGVRAIGTNSIASSLTQAGFDFSHYGTRSIVLLTDGHDSCGGDIFTAMSFLHSSAVPINLYVIGIALPTERETQFATFSKIKNARTSQQLTKAFLDTLKNIQPKNSLANPTHTRIEVQVIYDGKVMPRQGLRVTLLANNRQFTLAPTQTDTFATRIPPGVYSLVVSSETLEITRKFESIVVAHEDNRVHTLDLTTLPEVELEISPTETLVCSNVQVRFSTKTEMPNQWIVLSPIESSENVEFGATQVTGTEGTIDMVLPSVPGQYEARFKSAITPDNPRLILTGRSSSVEVHDREVHIHVSSPIPGSSQFPFTVTNAPLLPTDLITIAKPNAAENSFITAHASDGASAGHLRAPAHPGIYEIRYLASPEGRLIGKELIEITPVNIRLFVPFKAAAGSRIPVQWIGPNASEDMITIVPVRSAIPSNPLLGHIIFPEQTPSPARLQTPDTPGEYDILYLSGTPPKIIAKSSIRLHKPTVMLSAPNKAAPESTIAVEWSGPAGEADLIVIAPLKSHPMSYSTITYLDLNSSPLEIETPEEPGEYEIRYISGNSGNILQSIPLTIE